MRKCKSANKCKSWRRSNSKKTKVGKILTYFIVNGTKIEITISNEFNVKEMDKNRISYAKVTEKNKIISVRNTSKIYNKYNNLI